MRHTIASKVTLKSHLIGIFEDWNPALMRQHTLMASQDSDRAINNVPAERLAEQIQHCKGEVGVLKG
jgi:hypothetical protein